jgi:hypothetical protein
MDTSDYDKLRKILVEGVRLAVDSINKNSKIQTHMRYLVVMHNLMRVCVLTYDLGDDGLKNAQESLHKTINSVNQRHTRSYTTQDKITISLALEQYERLLQSCDDVQLLEMVRQLEDCVGMSVGTYMGRKAKL